MHFRPFEIALIGMFGLFAIGGLVFLSMFKGGDSDVNPYGEKVVIWGTFEQNAVDQILGNIATADKAFSVVSYKRIDERSFDSELLNAIADGRAPDLIMLPHTLLITYQSKLVLIPSETLNTRTYLDSYIDGASIFLQQLDGTYAIPFAVDPLILFWNRDLFANAGLARPPKTWEVLVSESTPALTRSSDRKTISQSAVGMGEYLNVNHAKEILSMLFFQAGTSLVEVEKDRYLITLARAGAQGIPPAQAALSFYTQFAAPGSNTYTWGRSQQFDRNAFTGGTLAMYFGLGSEIDDIENENPNLSFDIAAVPQAQGATALRNYGTFYGYAIPKGSRNASGALRTAYVLSEVNMSHTVASALGLTPVHRSSAVASGDVYAGVLRQSALISRGWLDPSPRETSDLFKTMIDNITLGRGSVEEVVNDASYTLESLFR